MDELNEVKEKHRLLDVLFQQQESMYEKELNRLRQENDRLKDLNDKYEENHVSLVNLIEEICASAKFLKPEIAVEEIKKEVELAIARGVKLQEDIV